MIPEREIQERLYRNRVLLLEAERERMFRMVYPIEQRPNTFMLALAYLGKWLIWLGTWMEAKYDAYNLRSC